MVMEKKIYRFYYKGYELIKILIMSLTQMLYVWGISYAHKPKDSNKKDHLYWRSFECI